MYEKKNILSQLPLILVEINARLLDAARRSINEKWVIFL